MTTVPYYSAIAAVQFSQDLATTFTTIADFTADIGAGYTSGTTVVALPVGTQFNIGPMLATVLASTATTYDAINANGLKVSLSQHLTFATQADLDAWADLVPGQVATVIAGALGSPEQFKIVAAGTYATPDGVLVRNLTASGLQGVSLRMEFASYAEADSDPRDNTGKIGCFSEFDDGWSYVASGQDFTTTGGNKVQVLQAANGMNARAFGALCDFDQTLLTGTDDTAAIQRAVTACIARNRDLYMPGISKIDPAVMVNIDRATDGAAFDNYFRIIGYGGGGFALMSVGAMFSSSYAFSTAPVSQLVSFEGITFIGASGAQYVLNDGRFLRMKFNFCNFDKILCVDSSIYLQSYSFIGNNCRRSVGTFFKAATYTYDLEFGFGNIAEAWTGDFLDLQFAIGCDISARLLEGISGTAIKYNGAHGLNISCYFEANGVDIDGTGTNEVYGVNLKGCYISASNLTSYSVIWGTGTISACTSIGNYHNGYMHNFPTAGLDILVKDYASGSLYNNEPNPVFNSTMSFNDGALGNGYGGTIKGYGVGGSGGFLGLGVLNAGVYLEGITIDQTGKVSANNAAVIKGATPLAGTGELGLGVTTATTATAGAGTLPAAPATFLRISIGGSFYKLAVYND